MALGDGSDTGIEPGGAAALLGDAGAAPAADAAAGGGDGGFGAGGEGGGGEGGGDGAAAPDWFEKLSATAGEGETSSNRDYAQAKGFKDLDGVFKSLRHAEKAIHDKGLFAVPGADAKPEAVAAFRAAIGVPDKPEGYEVKGPEGVPLNEPLINSLRESAVKHGAPKGAFEGLVSDFVQLQLDEAAAEKSRIDGEVADKVKEWGAKKDEHVAHIDAAARALGLTSADLAWFRTMPGGAGRALDLVSKLGSGMAEDTLITGGKGRFGVSGAEAQVELDRLKGDAEFQKAVMKPGSAERARWDRLNAAAAEAKARAAEG